MINMKKRLIQLAKIHKAIEEENSFNFFIHNVDIEDIPLEYYEHDGYTSSNKRTYSTISESTLGRSSVFSNKEDTVKQIEKFNIEKKIDE